MVLRRPVRTLLMLAAAGGAFAIWLREKHTGAALAAQVAEARAIARDAAVLRHETEALRRTQPDDAELQRLRADITRATPPPPAAAITPPPRLPLGTWRAAAEWTNRGYSTPQAAVETTLWAAAGGDMATLERSVVLDPDTRGKADALLAELSAPARAVYPTAERLIAAFTVKNIPVGEAQVVWQQEQDDTATIAVLLRNPPQSEGAAVFGGSQPAPAGPLDKMPPMQRADPRSGMVFLQLRRIDDRWKLVAPESALKKISADLRGKR